VGEKSLSVFMRDSIEPGMIVKRILFITNGLGMGNSTRCHAVLSHFDRRRFVPDVATSGNGLDYFSRIDGLGRIFALYPLSYGHCGKKLSLWKTLMRSPRLLMFLVLNKFLLLRILWRGHYSAVIIDSDYSLGVLRFFLGCPVVAINNSDTVMKRFARLAEPPRSLRPQFLIEIMDYGYHSLVPHYVLSPSLDHPVSRGKWRQFAPFIRAGLQVRNSSAGPERVVVMLSGSGFGFSTSRLREFARTRANMEFFFIGEEQGKVFDNRKLLNEADILVINGGFSAVSEAVCLQKPAVVVPIENHAEQYVNALSLAERGLGLMASEGQVVEQLEKVIKDFARFRAAHQAQPMASDGARQASQFIEQVAR